jgi:hypothetical protein
VGYRYLATLRGAGNTENRPIAEVTSHFKLPPAIFLSDRNRADFRFINNTDCTRDAWRLYANRAETRLDFSSSPARTITSGLDGLP